jgi:hypothetical protein
VKRKSRYQLADAWVSRDTAGKRYIGGVSTETPGLREALRYAFLMGYEASNRQESRKRLKLGRERDELLRLAPHQAHCESMKRANTPDELCTCWKRAYRAAILRRIS